MTLVFNASPLIVLAKARLLDRFLSLSETVVIPGPVAREVSQVDDPADPARIWVQEPAHQQWILEAPDILPFVAAWDLGSGESSVISLAEKIPSAVAVLDDLAARRCAQALRLPVIGTLGLALMAKKKGVIPSVRDALDLIVGVGLFISPRYLAAICREAGE